MVIVKPVLDKVRFIFQSHGKSLDSPFSKFDITRWLKHQVRLPEQTWFQFFAKICQTLYRCCSDVIKSPEFPGISVSVSDIALCASQPIFLVKAAWSIGMFLYTHFKKTARTIAAEDLRELMQSAVKDGCENFHKECETALKFSLKNLEWLLETIKKLSETTIETTSRDVEFQDVYASALSKLLELIDERQVDRQYLKDIGVDVDVGLKLSIGEAMTKYIDEGFTAWNLEPVTESFASSTKNLELVTEAFGKSLDRFVGATSF